MYFQTCIDLTGPNHYLITLAPETMPNAPRYQRRRSIRLKEYDYSLAGYYFITICCQDKVCRFGHIDNGEMVLNECGQIAFNEWVNLPSRFPNYKLDVFQIMPNHIHGIISLIVGATLAVAQNESVAQNDVVRAGASPAPTVGNIMGVYKSLVSNGCLDIYKSKNEIMGKLWQRNYYEHIIRNEKSYNRITEYIMKNPGKWADDKFFMK